MTRPLESLAILIGLCAWLAMGAAVARTNDRNQPMDLASNTSDCNIDGGTCHFVGNVKITQGTLAISSAKAELHRANGDLSRVILTGSPVTVSQEMDDGKPMNAQAAKVDYNLATDIVVFIGDAVIQQPLGILRGDRVVYNMATGQVTSGGEGSGRVKVRFLPKNDGDKADAPAPAAETTGDAAQDDG